MLINSIKEACDTLEQVVNKLEDGWDKNQAIDAINYLNENAFEKDNIIDEIKEIEENLNIIKTSLEMRK